VNLEPVKAIGAAAMQHVANRGEVLAVVGRGAVQRRISGFAVVVAHELFAARVQNFQPAVQSKTERSGLNVEFKPLAFLSGEGEEVLIAGRANATDDS